MPEQLILMRFLPVVLPVIAFSIDLISLFFFTGDLLKESMFAVSLLLSSMSFAMSFIDRDIYLISLSAFVIGVSMFLLLLSKLFAMAP